MMKAIAAVFTGPERIELREEKLISPGRNEILVRTVFSGISTGTEMLVYNGLMPDNMRADSTIPALAGNLAYPMKYGYSAVGQIIDRGKGVSKNLEGAYVAAFQPHQNLFTTTVNKVFLLPEGVSPESAIFLANMETAVNLVLDGRPMLGERVVVFGQGVVGLLLTCLMSEFPVFGLITFDGVPLRREFSEQMGAWLSLDPNDKDSLSSLNAFWHNGHLPNSNEAAQADLIYELSGNPEALDMAIAAAGYGSRVIIGSWYGKKKVELDLGGKFHRERISFKTSQVSTLAPELSARWTKNRRREMAWRMIPRIRPAKLITHRVPFAQISKAFALLKQNSGDVLQVVLTY